MARAALFLILGLLAACGSKDAARSAFAREYSCPDERVTVAPRDDVKWSSLYDFDTRGQPPEEVKKDPERLAKWHKDQDEQSRPQKEFYDSFDVWEASGCGHEMYVGCKRPAKSNGCGNPPICQLVAKTGAKK